MFIKLYFLALTIFLAIDSLWLLFISKSFYAKHLGFLMSKTPNLLAALIFYLIFIFGLLVLVLIPSLEKNSLSQAVIYAAIFGLCTYATYDLTNLATIQNWPLIITIVDLIWGTFISVAVSSLSFLISKWIF